ncbi:hypothetical protein K227x_53170 [Rubripirellula lacrimiformis]|uniref:Uncharacterized protein n=1 Tax=Rubripirellula lacrimiformis TaxID=1930273 RepID=A0A517NIC9_9BACT|nr:hypothetical protein [Rubripirellula lacrimiformis]QDT06894.1 hypothetical protein K227x_53170 [Rubripirellula lacrimiformis]
MTRDWKTAPMVIIEAAACPVCFALKPIIVRTEQGGDGSSSRRCVCRECSAHFLLVIEPPVPNSGSV